MSQIVNEADLRLMKQLIAKGDFSELLILIERRLEALKEVSYD